MEHTVLNKHLEDARTSYPKVIGIIGGLGPYAGIDLFKKIFLHTKAASDQEHLPILMASYPLWVADRTAFLMGKSNDNPGEVIGDIMVSLAQSGATVLGMPCNTAHCPPILDVALDKLNKFGNHNVKFVHIIDSAVNAVTNRFGEGVKVGLMGTIATLKTGLYQKALEARHHIPIIPSDEDCHIVHSAITSNEFGIKAFSDPVTLRAKSDLLDVANRLIEQGANVILLGCTEIPIAITEKQIGDTPVLDATTELALALLREAAPNQIQ